MKLRRRVVSVVVLLVVAGFGAVNAVAYLQVGAMTEFTRSGSRTPRPEDLSLLDKVRVILTGVNVPRPANRSTPDDVGLPFETYRLATRDGLGLEAWYVPGAGRRALFVLFHGYAASKESLLPVAKELHSLGHSTLLLDFRGSGGSGGMSTTIGYLEAEDVAATLSFARERLPEPFQIGYGFSMGGAALLRAIFVGAASPDAVVLEGVFASLQDTVNARFRTMGLPAQPFASILLFWAKYRWGFDPGQHIPETYATAVRVPTWILQGARDPRVTTQQAVRIRDALRGNKSLSVYAEMGHSLAVTAAPEQWRLDLESFTSDLGL